MGTWHIDRHTDDIWTDIHIDRQIYRYVFHGSTGPVRIKSDGPTTDILHVFVIEVCL